MEWKDTTSYSRGEERIPKTWTARIGDTSITVTTGHIHNPGRWVMHFRPWFDTYDLGLPDTIPASEAQAKALLLARHAVKKLYLAFETPE